MIFVDRVEETSRIEGALAGDKPALVVVYGRRLTEEDFIIWMDSCFPNRNRKH